MSNYAYLRVSTDEQDTNNQKHGLLEYAHKKDIQKYLVLDLSLSAIAKLVDTPRSTVNDYILRCGLRDCR